MNLTELSTIRALCNKHSFALSKGYGQNFIINSGVCPKIAEACGIQRGCGVIEIGPGFGVLTKELALRADKVIAIEIDKRLPEVLAETLSEFDNVKIILNDVLKCNLAQLISSELAGLRVMVCANLPYYITSPIIMRLLEERLPVESITVMVQKEAALRICAAPATREAGAVSYAVSYYARPEILFNVQPGSFYPPPKVTSSVIKLTPHTTPCATPKSEKNMFRVIRAAFSQRRKTAANSISAGLTVQKAQVVSALRACGVSEAIRPEQLTLQQFAAISDIVV